MNFLNMLTCFLHTHVPGEVLPLSPPHPSPHSAAKETEADGYYIIHPESHGWSCSDPGVKT